MVKVPHLRSEQIAALVDGGDPFAFLTGEQKAAVDELEAARLFFDARIGKLFTVLLQPWAHCTQLNTHSNAARAWCALERLQNGLLANSLWKGWKCTAIKQGATRIRPYMDDSWRGVQLQECYNHVVIDLLWPGDVMHVEDLPDIYKPRRVMDL